MRGGTEEERKIDWERKIDQKKEEYRMSIDERKRRKGREDKGRGREGKEEKKIRRIGRV